MKAEELEKLRDATKFDWLDPKGRATAEFITAIQSQSKALRKLLDCLGDVGPAITSAFEYQEAALEAEVDPDLMLRIIYANSAVGASEVRNALKRLKVPIVPESASCCDVPGCGDSSCPA